MSIIGLDIGGTKCAVTRATDAGVIERTIRFPTTDALATQARLWETVTELAPGPAPVFGISCGGPLDSTAGLILSPPNLPGWDRVPVCAELERRFGGRAFLMNDANAGALAEWQFGAGRGVRNLVFLTYGTGMGAGVICDGRLFEGANGNAGEIGHVRLSAEGPVGYNKAGSFEGWCSGGGIGRLAQAEARRHGGRVAFNPGRIEEISARHVVQAAEAGDALAADLLAESGRRLGQALAIVIDVLNPEVIVLGSVYSRARRWLEPHMRPVLEAEALPGSLAVCKVVPTALGPDIGTWAAIAIAVYQAGGFAREVRGAVDSALAPLAVEAET
ncbi:ROK family protein [Phenylobacterium sp.]|uniref:ROK family protein n=1 Tax=Phenylobacterium sp. TaxID=1871053 RepID=UPI00286DFE26|nr:ROK family protein [Phenylobacterium sp.]